MLSKRGQGTPIMIIVAAVIGLIIIVVVIAMLTGKLGSFGTGAAEANNCISLCKAVGYKSGSTDSTGRILVPGLEDDDGNQCYCSST